MHGGLLAIRAEPAHQAAMIANAIRPIDLLVVNLYPFEAALARGADFEDMIENIDIGGPAMIRAAAKNHHDVAVIVDVADYDALSPSRRDGGGTTLKFRRAMAQKAYARTAAYDAAISNWFAREVGETQPAWRAFGGRLSQRCATARTRIRAAAFYLSPEKRPGVASARQLQGKELSYNNINDTDAAYECVAEFEAEPAVAIIKHANPCGVAVGASLLEAYEKALACDPVSAFGGVVALNRKLDAEAARKSSRFSPRSSSRPTPTRTRSKSSRREKPAAAARRPLPDPRAPGLTVRSVSGGLLVQDRDNGALDPRG